MAQISSSIIHIAKPVPQFYSVFCQSELLEIIQALELRKEIPLKYSYKGRGAKIWDDFYLKFIIPTWYRRSNVEIDLLNQSFDYINGNFEHSKKINVIDVGAGNSYPVKQFIHKLNQLGKLNKYLALDISEELLHLSKNNFKKWFPLVEFISNPIDIENNSIPQSWLNDDISKIILHLGVTIGNHLNRDRVFKNFRESMGNNDLLVFTNEIGSNSQWDGKVRGGCNYHAQQIYGWVKNNIGIRSEDCELVRKYDLATDSVVANIRFFHDYTINFSWMGIDKNIQISAGEEITIWRHHKHELSELIQELKAAELELIHYNVNKYSSHVIAICKVA
ncbi:L-histidine N(alpha)-methyltransferase [Cronbergia sp. UHCC 0137]|uniref:L-histidine N(alpha)-methyltransferase n=1 Tax=Cronbergia sp. UHCC 0137 TaxID=3110239 RepID=UPI002B1F7AE1|nr:L-histidine N(alpha)-methyltransferase [Cronbergia sp. UHCC 0137]MEA5620362.1 L-histidine N(alpha)-methyltransferase [Cronbergia sp. UHCC 0137]